MYYKDAEHFKEVNGYPINGGWYPRVTKILDVKSKPGLENFFKEVGDYAAAEDIKQKSAEAGSLLHLTLQRVVAGDAVSIPAEILPAMEGFRKFNETRKIFFHPEFFERRIWSGRHRYAGTIDALATVDGKFGVLDIKTSAAFYPDYNLQTAAYTLALREFEIKRTLSLPRDIETRWILRIDQSRLCRVCGAKLREKGGRAKIRNGKQNKALLCAEGKHEWSEPRGEVELREFPYLHQDAKAFIAAKILWEWENNYWLRNIGYLTRDGA